MKPVKTSSGGGQEIVVARNARRKIKTQAVLRMRGFLVHQEVHLTPRQCRRIANALLELADEIDSEGKGK